VKELEVRALSGKVNSPKTTIRRAAMTSNSTEIIQDIRAEFEIMLE
jgi:hypothetical protein